MDPISQGALGAAATLALWGRDRRFSPKIVALLGALGGMAADLDILIRSSEDSLLAIEYHRNFTHSLAFVPIGATVALLPWLLRKDIRFHYRSAWLMSAVGYFTHAPLDCTTTYGTMFFWPFSDYRVSLSWVSVVDPLFTIPLLAMVVMAIRRRSVAWARVGLLIALGYLGLGAVQHSRTLAVQERLIARRGHEATRRAVFTTFMNQVTWRSLYESGGRVYVDQIRAPYLGRTCTKKGSSIVAAASIPQGLGPKALRGERLLRWFSSDWVAYDPEDSSFLFDLRYSLLPYGLKSFWGVRTSSEMDGAEWVNTRNERKVRPQMVVDLIFRVPTASICEE